MSKAAKINQIREIRDTLKNDTLPEFIRTHQNFSIFDGSDLSESKQNMRQLVTHLDRLIEDNIARLISWHSFNNILSTLQSTLNIYSQFKHALDQASFQNLSSHLDSCLQQIHMYGIPATWIEDNQLSQNKDEIERLSQSIEILKTTKNQLEQQILDLEKLASTPIDNLNKRYDETLHKLGKYESQIEELVGTLSNRSIAGGYGNSAKTEKLTAELLRVGSLLCMMLIIAIVGHTFWQSIDQSVEWTTFAFRTALAFMLSIPAAYLARESSKHREQQYHYQQTSLDLAAIEPYLAPLEKDLQQRIKAEIAGKIFTIRDFSRSGKDSYPINSQEVIMELLKILDRK